MTACWGLPGGRQQDSQRPAASWVTADLAFVYRALKARRRCPPGYQNGVGLARSGVFCIQRCSRVAHPTVPVTRAGAITSSWGACFEREMSPDVPSRQARITGRLRCRHRRRGLFRVVVTPRRTDAARFGLNIGSQ